MTTLADDLHARLATRGDIELAILFGSGARGRLQPSSDVDLAVRWRGTEPAERDVLLADLERAIGRTIDFVELDSAFDVLADHGVLGRPLADRMRAIVRVRSRIAHGYSSVDHVRIHAEATAGIASLRDFFAAVIVAATSSPEP